MSKQMAFMRHQYHMSRLLLEANDKTSNLNNEQANFDINMVMILAVFVFALIFALAVNSILRCVSRYSSGFVHETQEEVALRLASSGMNKDDLRQIPKVVYKTGVLNIVATDCPICLGEFRDGEVVRVLPKCNHGFHVKCIDTWLLARSSCPTCRRLLVDCPSDSVNLNTMEGTITHGTI